MPRPLQLPSGRFTSDQLAVYHDMIEKRGFIPEPHRVWLLRPELARNAGNLGSYFQNSAALPPRLAELAILLIGHYWLADYTWRTHVPRALESGISESVVEAISQSRRPDFVLEDEALLYDTVTTLHKKHAIDDGLYESAVTAFGREGLVDLAGIIGYYTLIAATIKIFAIEGGKA